MKVPHPAILFTIILFSCLTLFSQNGWQTNQYYAQRGSSSIQTNYQTEINPYTGYAYQAKYCRRLDWHQQFYSGQVYYWAYNPYTGRYEWMTEWREGNFWYCVWTGWYRCT